MGLRGTTNGNARGNTKDRAARKRWLLKTYAANVMMYRGWDDNLTAVPVCRCYRCGMLLDESQLTVDRIIPGCQGGKYTRDNIRPACAACNSETGGAVRR